MKSRCLNKNYHAYSRYGGRGIKICDRWLNGEGGMSGEECFSLDMGKRPSKNHSIDRINNDGNYEPDNCKWSTRSEQQNNVHYNNRVDYKGENLTIAELIKKYNVDISRQTMTRRIIKLGWDIEKAINTPVRASKKYKKRTQLK
jgi:hypothetical protein